MKKTIVCLLLVLVLVLTSSGLVTFAAQPDRTYTYEEDNTPVPSTNAYQVRLVVDEAVMGTTPMKNPTDVYVDNDDYIYILDAGNFRVLILDTSYKCIKELAEFNYNGEVLTLGKDAKGLFYREENKKLYIADTSNDRIIVTDLEGNVSNVYGEPIDEDGLLQPDDPNKSFSYKPEKIIVDNMGIMYVASGDTHEGILLVDSANRFLGFYGTNKLKMTTAMQITHMWRKLLKNAVMEETYQPVQFKNLFWSEDRFVYTVSPLKDYIATSVSKLNALGNNVFPKDIDYYQLTQDRKVTIELEDITVDNEGAITILDKKNGHLYQYDEGCNLLVVFGGIGYQEGLFEYPVSIESASDNSLMVLDSRKNSLTVMEQTFYGQMIRSANYLYNEGLYYESIEPWNEVLRMNANYTQAYIGLGKAYISLGEYEQAMWYFEQGNDQEGYAEAKAALRDERIRANFGWVAGAVILILLVILFFEKVRDFVADIYWRIRK